MNGVGGDAFGLFFDGETGEVTALNGSGRAGTDAEPSFFGAGDAARVPSRGAGSVTVPGAVAAWIDAHERFGTLPFPELLAPAIRYARDGFPVSSRLNSDIAAGRAGLNGPAESVYLPSSEAPAVGSLLRNPALATTLEAVANGGRDAFYTGRVAQALAAFIQSEGGHITEADIGAHESTWVEPLSVEYLGHRFHMLPPNTQGLTQLQFMEMAKGFDLKEMGLNSSSYLHTLIELKKLAFADRDAWIGDPEATIPIRELSDPDYLAERARQVDPTAAASDVQSGIIRAERISDPAAGGALALSSAPYSAAPAEIADDGDTVYLTAVDQWGNAVSWIQSLFNTFGSGLMEPETGIMLHNRGSLFTLEAGHPNRIAPGKRPFHTLTPLLALRGEEFGFTLGTPGGDAQTQSLLQIINNLLIFGMTPQEAVEYPRFRSQGGLDVSIEDRIPLGVRDQLTALGHDLTVVSGWTAVFGGAQMILLDPLHGTLVAASDPRREAYGIAY